MLGFLSSIFPSGVLGSFTSAFLAGGFLSSAAAIESVRTARATHREQRIRFIPSSPSEDLGERGIAIDRRSLTHFMRHSPDGSLVPKLLILQPKSCDQAATNADICAVTRAERAISHSPKFCPRTARPLAAEFWAETDSA